MPCAEADVFRPLLQFDVRRSAFSSVLRLPSSSPTDESCRLAADYRQGFIIDALAGCVIAPEFGSCRTKCGYFLLPPFYFLISPFGITPIFCAKAMKRGSSL